MSKLRLHPDLGGDHEAASLINQAYAVLGDRDKRRQYDHRLQQERARAYPQPRGSCVSSGAAAGADMQPGCPYCQAVLPPAIEADTRCRRCDSPLVPAPPGPARKYELFGRRSVPRIAKSQAVTLHPGWQLQARSARLRDLSTAGISVVTDVTMQANQAVRIVGPLFDVLAKVVSCRRDGHLFVVHARLVKAIFTRRAGVLVSVTA